MRSIPSRAVPTLRRAPAARTLLLSLGASLALLAGCEGSGERTDGDGGATALVPVELDRTYIVGPTVAREIGYRIDWQHPGTVGRPAEHVVVGGDSIFTLDDDNVLARHLLDTGQRLWTAPVDRRTVEFFGMNWIEDEGRVYLSSGNALYGVDAAGGTLAVKQRLQRVGNTAPVRFGQFLLYGSREGEVVWHSYRIGAYWRGYRIAPTIGLPPVVSEGVVVGVGADGTVMAITAAGVQQIWSYTALEPVVAQPEVADDTVFVASLDQHLRAFDLFSDRGPLWQHLFDRDLVDAPVAMGDRVYQNVPGRGLHCLEARPQDQPGGVVIWQAEGTTGNVLTETDGRLILWDADERRIEIVDPRLGALIEAYDVPQVRALLASSKEQGLLLGIGDDGRVIRLTPRTRSAA